MREVKYRAWDKRTKYMAEVVGFKYTLNGKIEIWYKHDDKDIDLATYEKKYIVLMQYTGLKDKKGNEIYEGDVLRLASGKIRTVFKVKGGFAIESLDMDVGKYGKIFCCPIESLADEQNAGYIENQAEVIGNIHDNPELLESEE